MMASWGNAIIGVSTRPPTYLAPCSDAASASH